jgi:hypothetical protein
MELSDATEKIPSDTKGIDPGAFRLVAQCLNHYALAFILNGKQIPQGETAKYLGIHLDRRLTWQTNIFAKRKQMGLKFQQMYWILGRKSQLSIENKLLIHKTVVSAKETTDRTYLRCCPNQGVWIRIRYFEGVREWRWLCSVTFTDCSW